MPITTLSDGTAIAVIQPYSSIYNAYNALNATYLPFVTCAAGSSTNPFAATPTYGAAGPFYSQVNNIVTYNIDSCTIDFQ